MKQFVFLLIAFTIIACGKNKRTQEPKEPFSYESREVNFKSHQGDVTLSGTLTTPTDDTLHTAVILIGGSGRTNRNYTNNFGHRPFLVISDYLTRHGITVLRYDERGVGKSEGNYEKSTFEELVADVAGGIDFLRNELPQIKVGLIGHSEGAQIAPLVALQSNTDFLVLMGASLTTADSSLIFQTGTRLKGMNVDQKTSQEIIMSVDSLLRILKSEKNVETARTKMYSYVDHQQEKSTADFKNVTKRLGDPYRLVDGFLDPKFIYRLHHDSKLPIREVHIPVLVLYGDRDGTVDVDYGMRAFKQLLDANNSETIIFSGVNHLFMKTGNLSPDQFHSVEETIAPEVLTKISTWIYQL